MKTTSTKKTGLILLLACVLALAAVFTIVSFADTDAIDAMIEIEASFNEEYLIGEKYVIKDDGYIGIPVELTTYYDADRFGSAKTGYYGTNIVLYFVNTNVERVGTENDVDIIRSMLDRGYAVVVVDYLNNPKAKSPVLDWSSQIVRKEVLNGKCFSDKNVFPSGTYRDTYVVPAGYDVTPFANFWSLDKHGAEGSLDRIVDVWNTDFRSSKGNTVIEWIREEVGANGETVYVKKATQTAFDGSEPVWYSDAKGTVSVSADSPDAKYIKVKHTLALDITDCVAKDGTGLDLDLHMHIVYPVNPENPVPVMMISGSSGYLTTAQTGDDLRPQPNGYLFNGYAGVIYDHLWIPMATDEYYSSFDGNAKNNGVSKDNVSYSVFSYNSQRVDTAAVRYLKYLTYTEPEKYSFDPDGIGIIGNSKGGMFIFIGSAELREYTVVPEGMTLSEAIDARINAYVPSRIYAGKTGESRYQYGITDDYTIDGITIRGGEMQPWMTYVDENGTEHEILASTSFVYAANGSNVNHIKEGHAAIFTAMCTEDPLGNGYASSNQIANAAKNMDIPCMYVVVDLGHTVTYGMDAYHNIDTYDALFAFSNYYLRGDAVKVIYTEPAANLSGIDTTAPITIKFSGTVEASEMAKVTLKDSLGNTVVGEWTSEYGGTEWTFTHDALKGGEKYTLVVPAGFSGDNGAATTESYTATYITSSETTENTPVIRAEKGLYFTVSHTNMKSASEAKIRFYVENDAANAVGLYLVSGFDSANPDASAIGSCLGKTYLVGAGYYEIDVSSVVGELSEGESVTMLLKTEKTASTTEKVINFADEISALGDYKYMITESSEAPDGTKAAKITLTTNVASDGTQQYLNTEYYPANASILNTWRGFINSNQKLTDADMGRKFTATLTIYDTISRPITVTMNNATSSTYETLDFDYVLFTVDTKAGEWTEIVIDYTVYEKIFGAVSNQGKRLTVTTSGDGVKQSPLYLSTLTTVETVTDVEFGDVSLVLNNRDGNAYKKAESTSAFAIGDKSYATLSAAMSTYKNGEVITLKSNYTLTSSDNGKLYGNYENVVIDLNGYKLYSDSSNPTFTLGSGTASVKTTLTIKNGSIFTGNAPIVGYSDTYASGKNFDIVFENVSILATDMSTITSVMSAAAISNDASANITITLNECLLKIEKERIVNNPITVFPGGEGNLNVSYVLNGGKIVTDTFVRVNLYDDYRDLTLGDNKGSYTTIEVPSCRSIPEIWATRSNDIGIYVIGADESGITTLEVVTNPNATKYGIFLAEYTDANVYPFMLFDSNGTFIGAYKEFLATTGALEAARALNKENAFDGTRYPEDAISGIILVRRDYELTTTEKFDNLAQLQGEVTIDLNGFTLTQSNSWTPIFNAATKSWNSAAGKPIFPTTVRVINGTLLTYKCGIIVMSTWESLGNGAIAGKNFNFIFDNVTLGFADGAETAVLLTTYNNPTTTGDRTLAAPFGLTFNDCTFDLTNRNSSKSAALFSTATADKFIDVDITVNGSKIVTNDLKNIDLINPAGDYTSSVTFGEGSDGKYLTLEINSGASVGDDVFVLDNGEEKTLNYLKTIDSKDIYGLDDNPLKTEYGVIPESFADASAYPIVAFEKTSSGYTFIGGYAELGAASSAVVGYTGSWNKNFVVLLRADATADTYKEISSLTGSYTLDLGGHTLTLNTYYIFYIFRNSATSSQRATCTIKNGRINKNLSAGAVLGINYGTSSQSGFKVPFVCENVTFASTSSAATYGLFRSTEDKMTSVAGDDFCIDVDVTFNNCTFDYKNSKSVMKMFDMTGNNSGDRIKYDVKVNGGSIIANDSFTYSNLIATDGNANGRADKITFGKNAAGEYITLVLQKGANAPNTSEIYVNESGVECVFVQATEGAVGVTYRLRPLATVGFEFTPKMSITLESQLVLNVYIPVESLLKFTFDDENYENLALLENAKKIIDGKEYYRISTPLASTDAAMSLKLVATLDLGTDTALATFTFSIPKYCAKLIASETSSDLEKTLAKDVLVYVKEAYRYFDKFNTKEEIASVVALIDSIVGDYTGVPVSSGEVNTVDPVVAVTLNLDNKPSIRFYVSDTNVSFYLNGSKLNTVSGVDVNGTYIELDVYAYVLSGTITYGNGGSYHVSDYVSGANGQKYEALSKSFVKYTESAAAYRTRVVDTMNHKFIANVVSPGCISDGYTIYTCSDCGYSYEDNYVEAHGHTWGEWYVSEEITKTSDGKMRQDCYNCDSFNIKDIAAVTTGNFGKGSTAKNNAIYTIYEDGTLKITGSGDAFDCGWKGASQPYIEYREFINRVIVTDGITSVGKGSFAHFPNLEYSDLSTSITEYPQGLFMESYAPHVTTIVVPENITKVGTLCFGRYEHMNEQATLMTAVYFENPNTVIVEGANGAGTPYLFVNTYTFRCANLVIYSYGTDNNVKAYADKFGITYVDLNSEEVLAYEES